ncbi:MAG: hypothetical protein KF789_11375 [Bdellovibrionaceae bacterium]|nr:hypothetical protein [Pseudobdellovibrionaceae bacterium]
MKRKISFLFLAMALALVACQPREQELTGGDPLEESYRLIDKGEYNQAIQSLEELASRDSRPAVVEALASAYAARAGVLVSRYWGAVVGFKAPLIQSQESRLEGLSGQALRVLSQVEGRKDLTGADEFSKLARFLSVLGEWQERIDRLPTIPARQRDDLREALGILENHKAPGGRLYRALLGLILLKSEINDGFTGWESISASLAVSFGKSPGKVKGDLLCVVDYEAFASWTRGLVKTLQSTALDVAVAYPSKKIEIEKAVDDSEKIASQYLRVGGRACP